MQTLASVALNGVSKSFGPNRVLDNVSFTLGPHTRAGVIGRNGAGKSTLLKIVARDLEVDSGTVECSPGNARIGYLHQEHDSRHDETVMGYLERRTGVDVAAAELEAASIDLGSGSSAAADRFDRALGAYEGSGAADLDIRARKVLVEVGLSKEFMTRATSSLSGGQLARIGLASILLSRFDLLLLDEPTNDLDFAGLALLEEFCVDSPVGMLIVSHDREFLDRTTNAIVEIDLHDHTAQQYSGGWAVYQEERETRDKHAQERYEQYESKRDDLKQRARTQRDWATSGVNKAKRNPRDKDKMQRDFFLNKTEKQASKARATEKALDRLERVDKPWEGWDLQMQLPQAPRAGDVAFDLQGIVVKKGSFTLGPIDLHIESGERVAITGPNGAGKSTLLSVLLGKVSPSEGRLVVGPSTVIGDLDQARNTFSSDASLIDVFVETTGVEVSEARSVLAKFDLKASMVVDPASRRSAGERTRAVLAAMMATQTNCVVLDEPSNHLDIEAIEQLEGALAAYTGTVIVVTHDRRMLEAVTFDRQIAVENGLLAKAPST